MRAIITLLALALAFASCRTSKDGCPGTKSTGPRFKSQKFEWYRG